MASDSITSEDFDRSSAPDLLSLYPLYLTAFNAHSWPDILHYLSATCHFSFRGKLMNTSAEDARPNYEKDFVRCEKHDISIKEMKPIERIVTVGEEEEEEWKKGIRWGLRLVLYDPELKRTVTINYWYREEGGKWMQGWHEILDSVFDETI